MRPAFGFLVAAALSACSTAGNRPPAVSPETRALQRLTDADALVKAGCFDCLRDALTMYDEARTVPAAAERATMGAARTAALLALRERELGLPASDNLTRAEALAAALPQGGSWLTPLLEIVASMPDGGGAARGPSSDAQLAATLAARRNRDAWTVRLAAGAADNPLTAYLWLGFSCAYGTPTPEAVVE